MLLGFFQIAGAVRDDPEVRLRRHFIILSSYWTTCHKKAQKAHKAQKSFSVGQRSTHLCLVCLFVAPPKLEDEPPTDLNATWLEDVAVACRDAVVNIGDVDVW